MKFFINHDKPWYKTKRFFAFFPVIITNYDGTYIRWLEMVTVRYEQIRAYDGFGQHTIKYKKICFVD